MFRGHDVFDIIELVRQHDSSMIGFRSNVRLRWPAAPYDLRHAAASLWLNSGVPATEVARRLGHGVAVLLRVYANCLDGQDNVMNDRIEDALGE